MNHLTEEIKHKAKELRKDYPTLSVYESLNLAVKIQKNQLYARANVISEENHDYPPALEAIAMSLGYTNRGFTGGYFDNEEITITGYLEEINEYIKAIADKLPEDIDQY